MRSVFATFIVYLAVIATGLVVYTSVGFARNADNGEPAAAARAFTSALERDDGAAACGLLSTGAVKTVEAERKKPCDQGIVEIKDDVAPAGEPSDTDIAERSAFVKTGTDDAVFLDKTDAGWKISASGCKRQAGDAPYDCELEG